jgi:tight adherence protein B
MNPTWVKAVALVCLFGAVLLFAETLVRWIVSRRNQGRAINFRMKLIGQGRTSLEAMNVLRRSASSVPSNLPSFLANAAHRFEQLLIAAQVRMPTGRLMLIILLAPFAVFLTILIGMAVVGAPTAFGRLLLVATFSVVAGAIVPIFLLQIKASRTRKRMQEQFPVALDVFVRGLRAGHPIAAALDLLTVEMPDPIGSQFGLVVDEVTYGAELRDALQAMAERWDLDDMRMFVVSLSVQSETGGNLAEILENLAKVIRDRHSMMLKVRALSSEGRMTALMLTILPVFAFTVLCLLNPAFYLDVADDPAFVPGFVVLILLYAVGFIWIRRLVDIKV